MGSEDDFQQARGAILLRLIGLNVFLATASVVFIISLTFNIGFVLAGEFARFLVGLIFFSQENTDGRQNNGRRLARHFAPYRN